MIAGQHWRGGCRSRKGGGLQQTADPVCSKSTLISINKTELCTLDTALLLRPPPVTHQPMQVLAPSLAFDQTSRRGRITFYCVAESFDRKKLHVSHTWGHHRSPMLELQGAVPAHGPALNQNNPPLVLSDRFYTQPDSTL
jgi:hypothetical protein